MTTVPNDGEGETNLSLEHDAEDKEEHAKISKSLEASHETETGDAEAIYGTTEQLPGDEEVDKDSEITVDSNGSSGDGEGNVNTSQHVVPIIERTGSHHHSYEEIPPSEANSEVCGTFFQYIRSAT